MNKQVGGRQKTLIHRPFYNRTLEPRLSADDLFITGQIIRQKTYMLTRSTLHSTVRVHMANISVCIFIRDRDMRLRVHVSADVRQE